MGEARHDVEAVQFIVWSHYGGGCGVIVVPHIDSLTVEPYHPYQGSSRRYVASSFSVQVRLPR